MLNNILFDLQELPGGTDLITFATEFNGGVLLLSLTEEFCY